VEEILSSFETPNNFCLTIIKQIRTKILIAPKLSFSLHNWSSLFEYCN